MNRKHRIELLTSVLIIISVSNFCYPEENCLHSVSILQGDTCWGIYTSFGITFEQLRQLNPTLDCDHLQIDQRLCIQSQNVRSTQIETPQNCEGFGMRVVKGDSCWKIVTRNDLTEQQLLAANPSLNCQPLHENKIICIPAQGGKSSSTISPSSTTSTTTTTTTTKQPETETGQSSTVESTSTHRAELGKCSKTYSIIAGDTCWKLQMQFNISNEIFMALNPGVNCDNLQINQKICISKNPTDKSNNNSSNVNCTKWHSVIGNDTCWKVWTQNQLNETEFYAMNPLVECDRLHLGDRLCIAEKNMTQRQCYLTYTIRKDETCSDIAEKGKITLDQLQRLNPNLNCSVLQIGRIICLSRFDAFEKFSEPTSLASQNLLRAGANAILNSELADRNAKNILETFLNTRNNSEKAGDILLDIFAQPNSIDVLKELTKSNNEFRQIQESFLARREIICDQLTRNTKYKQCLCSESSLLLHCQAMLIQQMRSFAINNSSDDVISRTRRETSNKKQFNAYLPASDLASLFFKHSHKQNKRSKRALKSKKAMKISESFISFQSFINKLCFGCMDETFCIHAAGCFPIPVVPILELCIHGEACLPNPVSLIESQGRLTVKQFLDSEINLGVGICITGVREILSLIGINLCIANFDLTYYYLRQQLDITPSISLAVVRARFNVRIQLTDSLSENLYDTDNGFAIEDLCDEEEFGCRDFCLLESGQVIATYKVEVFFGIAWVTVAEGDISRMPDCERIPKPPKPVPLTLERLVLYTTSWAQYRASDGLVKNVTVKRPESCKAYAQTPKNISRNLATHINYAFLVIDKNTFEITNFEKNDDELMGQMVSLKDANTKVLVSIGGWSFSQGETDSLGVGSKDIFSNMASSSANRERFISSVINYINRMNLDGVDIDWEYPEAKDSESFTLLMKELKAALDSTGKGLLLTFAAPAGPKYYKVIDLKTVSEYCDFVNLMSYDFHGGSFETNMKPQVNAPIVDCTCPDIGDILLAVNAYLAAGVPAKKINLGLATYGRTFKLDSSGNSVGPAEQGVCTLTPGVLSYYEILDKHADAEYDKFLMAVHSSYGDNEWVGYDNEQSHEQKMCFARSKGLGGVMIWDAELDKEYMLAKNIKDKLEVDCNDYETPKCDGKKSRKKRAATKKTPSKNRGPPKKCVKAPQIKHADKGKLRSCANREIGRTCTISCEKGYEAKPKNIVTCIRSGMGRTRNGKWDNKAKCYRKTPAVCGQPPFPIIPVYSAQRATSVQQTLPPYYVVQFNTQKGIPLWSIYAQRTQKTKALRYNKWKKHECYADKQLNPKKFSTQWHKGHLSPQQAFNYAGVNGQMATNLMINAAPQFGGTNSGPWRALEDRLQDFFVQYPGYVITGTCPKTTRSSGLVIPSCFWKIACTRMPNGTVTTSAYYHQNTPTSNKPARLAEVQTMRSKDFITALFHSAVSWNKIWANAVQLKANLINNLIPSLSECRNSSFTTGTYSDLRRGFVEGHGFQNNATEFDFWREMLLNRKFKPDFGDWADEDAWEEINEDYGDDDDDDDEEEEEEEEEEDEGFGEQPYNHCGTTINKKSNND